MWLWESELNEIGFRHRSRGYWQCERGFGLPEQSYVSLFVGGKVQATRAGRARQRPVEVSSFHITFMFGADNLHFYYHEQAEGIWEPGGYTSAPEIRRYEIDPRQLCDMADKIAARLTTAWRGVLLARQ